MTLRELSQLYWLKSEIKMYEERLMRLRACMGVGSPNYDGMPKAQNNESTTERQAVRLADLERTLKSLRDKALEEEARLTCYIATIPDAYLRIIFTHRFVHGLTWWQVAAEMGGETTADSVRKACVRYIERGTKSE